MRAVFFLVLVAGLGLAGGAVFLAKGFIDGYENALAAERAKSGSVDTTDIFIVTKPVTYGDQITPKDVQKMLWPRAAVPRGAYFKIEDIFPNGEQQPRAVLRSIEPGEPILEVKLTKLGEPAGLTALLERGERAFTIRVDVSSGVSGFLRPGHYVDVFWTGRAQGGEVTKLIQSSMRVIAIDQSANEEVKKSGIARTVTVAVSPQQVAALAQAEGTGRLTLALVGSGDELTSEAVEIDQNALLGIVKAEAPVAAPEEKVCTVRTRRGAEVVEIPIPCTN